MKFNKSLIFSILLSLLFSSNNHAAKPSPIEFGMFDMPPFYTVKDGRPTGGICYDIMIQMLEKAKLPYETRVYPAPRLYANLVNGKTQVFIGIKNAPVYKDKVLYGQTPVSNAELGVYSIAAPSVKTSKDLIGKSVIVVRGYAYGGLIDFLKDPRNKIQLMDTTTHQSALKMLEGKRGEYLLDYTATINEILKFSPNPKLKLSVLSNIPLYLIVSKSTPQAQKLLDKLMTAFEKKK